MATVIKNGLIISPEKSFRADILIEKEKIKKIGKNLSTEECRVIDATDKFVIPGGVDVHTHLDLDLGNYRVVDDFYTGTVAAAFGGTTTIVDHIAFGPKNCSLMFQINKYHELAKGKAIIDYSFHGVFQRVNEDILEEMKKLVREGITSFKIYMTYENMLTDEEILKVLFKAKEVGVVIAVHAENNGAVEYLREYYVQKGNNKPIFHARSRPDSTEAEAINRMIYLSEIAGYPHLYFVHVSTKKGLEEIIAARKRGVRNIYCETCTQYLTLTEERYLGEDCEGLKYIMAPPLRKKEDVEALWEGIRNDHVDVIATDHCPFKLEQKLQGKDDFRIAPGGIPGVEERIEIILTEGKKRKIPLENLVSKLATNPARIYGLYPKKGIIEIGSDADLILLKENKKVISTNNRHGAGDYTAYAGFEVDFSVDTVIQRGNIIIEDDKLLVTKGAGLFIKRETAKYPVR